MQRRDCETVRLSACPIMWLLHGAVAVLLLWTQQAEDTDQLLHSRRSAVAAAQHGLQQQMRAVPRCQLM